MNKITSIFKIVKYLICALGISHILFGTANASSVEAAFGKRDITLNAGEVKIIDLRNMTRVAVGDGKLLQAQALETGELLLIGKNQGTTTLQVWHSENQRTRYRVNITDSKNEQDITLRKIVSIKVRIVEFRESSLKKIGLDWNKTSAGPSFFIAKDFISSSNVSLLNQTSENTLKMVGSTSHMPLFLGSTIALNSTINFMQTAGHATTLAEPTLSCLSGESASFLAGGEIPFGITNSDGEAIVSFKEYGIKLEVKPKADRHGRVSTEIATEVSSVDGTVSVDGAPGFLTRKTQTHMNVMSGQTIVISGLLSKEFQESANTIPGMAKIPIIGPLFTSKNTSQEERQLVIFLTPTIIKPENINELASSTLSQTAINPQLEYQQLNTILNQGLADITIGISNEKLDLQ